MRDRTYMSLGEEGRALLQRRVALLGKVIASINALGVVVQLVLPPRDSFSDPAVQLLTLSIAFPLVMWLMCRRGRLSQQSIRLVEASSMLGLVLCIAVMGRYLQVRFVQPGGPLLDSSLDPAPVMAAAEQFVSVAVVLGLTYCFVLRAALVPSRPRYCAGLTATLGVPVALIWLPDAATFGAPHLTLMTRSYVGSAGIVNVAVWWTFTTIVSTVITWLIYGLRRQVAAAKKLGQYSLESKVGEGGMGSVYRARHALMQRPTAIKLLSRDAATEAQVERFEREVQLTTRLTHPNTITIFDYGRTADGEFYYVMELLDGATLDEIVAVDGAQPPERVVQVLWQVAGALVEAHQIGLVHRDIKPSNIILCTRGGKADVVKLLDFGLVKEVKSPERTEVTSEATLTGTPLYMSPEAITSPKRVGERSDLYSLGAVGYFLLTGSHVFDGDTMVEVCGHHLHADPEPPSKRLKRHVPEDLEKLLLQCLAKQPAERPQTAGELLDRLAASNSFGSWTDDQALIWWEAHDSAIRKLRGRPKRTQARTIAKAIEAD